MLRVRVLGDLALEIDGRPLPPPPGRPARAVLGWLAIHPGTHERAAVAAALWPDVLDTSARASLRTALSAVRQALGPAADALAADRQTVGLDGVTVDALDFDALLDDGRPAEALAVGDGELLAGLDDEWATSARDRHRDRRGAALAAFADAAEREGDLQAALESARRRADLDHYDEPAHRDLIALLARAGDRGGALAAYERFVDRLRRELAVAPSAVTRELVATLREQDAPADAPALPARLAAQRWRSAFVGRDEALDRLRAAWTAAEEGGIAFAVVFGDPGIGKTRLAARFATEVHAQGAAVLAGRADEEPLEPYQPIVEAIRPAGALAADLEPSSDDRAGRLRLREGLADALERAAATRALLVVLDDLHWADTATLEFLRWFAGRGSSARILMLATSRPGELRPGRRFARAIGDVARDAPLTRIALSGLSRDETAALVGERAGAALAEAEVEALAQRTGGNPFFLEALVDAGLADPADELPADVAELVAERLDWLGPRVATLLPAGAVLGRDFEVELAAAVANIEPEDALAAADAAAAAHLVVAGGAGRMAFVHALVQEALGARAAAGERARLHARAVDALSPRAEAGSDDALVAAARHALAATPVVAAERAGRLAERAASALVAAHAPADAAALLERAAVLCDEAGEPVALRAQLRCSLGEALLAADRSDEASAAFAEATGLARRAGDGGLLARAALGAAGPGVTIARAYRERVVALDEALGAVPEDDAALRSRVQARLAFELAYDPDGERRDRLSTDALATARSTRDPRALAAALGARHVVLWGPDHTRERLALADEMIGLARRADDAALELQGRTWRIIDLDEIGDGPAIEAELDAYAATAMASGLSAYAWYVPAWRAARAGLAGRADDARELQRHALELGRRLGDANVDNAALVQWLIPTADDRIEWTDAVRLEHRVRTSPAGWAYRAMYTWALVAAGREDEARSELAAQRAAGVPRSWPRDTNWLSAAKELTEAAAALGERELGAELAELLTPLVDRMVVSARALFGMGAVAGVLGRLADLAGDRRTAVERYEQAIERDERAGALIWAVNHRRRLGEALLAERQRERGLEQLARVAREAPALGLWRQAELAQERLTTEAATRRAR